MLGRQVLQLRTTVKREETHRGLGWRGDREDKDGEKKKGMSVRKGQTGIERRRGERVEHENKFRWRLRQEGSSFDGIFNEMLKFTILQLSIDVTHVYYTLNYGGIFVQLQDLKNLAAS